MASANVMILADNSLSMDEIMYDDRYDPDVVYAGNFSTDATYYVRSSGRYTPSSFNRRWPTTPSANLVASNYVGNYMNFIFFALDDVQRLTIPTSTRIEVLREVLTDLVDRSEQLKFGMTEFDGDQGGKIIAECGADHAYVRSEIANITSRSYTPLGEAMETILDYFADSGSNAPIQDTCQYNFVIVVTDGLPTRDIDVSSYLVDADGDGNDPGSCSSLGAPYGNSFDCSDHFDDVAYYMAHNDLRPDMDGMQNVSTYVVGFNVNAPILHDAAVNGQGLYFHANSAAALLGSIEYAIQDVLRRISAGSAVAVVSTERGTDDRLYRGKFMPLDWHGFLESYALPYVDGDRPVWEAGDLLTNRRTPREIFTALGDRHYDFDTGSAPDLKAAMNVFTDDEAGRIIEWARGNDVAGKRDRQGWLLGDIIHSTPVVVGPPSGFQPTEAYQNFRTANENRRKLVYVGANDGMLHAFDAESGDEAWAFVPEFALPTFEVMADSGYCHRYSCDQTVSVQDIKVNGTWRTILASGGREGSAAIYAMDITAPDAPEVKWQVNLPNGMTFHSEIEMVSIGGTAVALVGSGLDETAGESWLYAYEVSDGTLLGSVLLSRDPGGRNRTGRPAVVDLNLDGETDLIYVADMLGNVYRFDTGGSAYPADWRASDLYRGTQEITADPTVAFGENGAVYVYFGTGAYVSDPDMLNTDQQSFVCVFDRHSGETLTRGDLTNQTNSIQDIGNDRGWYVNLWNGTGERVTEQAVVVAETVIFTSFAPSSETCAAGGESWLYQMRYDSGGIPDNEDMENPDDRSVSVGEGIASYPVVDLTGGEVVVQSSDASISVVPIASGYQRMAVRSWQERFDVVVPPPADGTQTP
ncbi:PQQ-binding-like beta-propeller repeat protein [bacterium]|nr:PQQ-binding-like beta-propeller repeat protein [bacterium]